MIISLSTTTLHPCLSVFIRVPKKFGVCRGVLLRALTGFGVKGDKALFLTLGILGISNFRHFSSVFICVPIVFLRPIER